jgi:hypothetical protein
LAKQPHKIITTGADSYAPKNPGEKAADYDVAGIMNQPDLPEVAPPSATSAGGPSPTMFAAGASVDPNAPDVLKLVQGCKFKTPFTITLMKQAGKNVFKSDAGTKTEDKYEVCKETIKDPSDILRLLAAVKVGVYKPLNDMGVEFQLMMYMATQHGILA